MCKICASTAKSIQLATLTAIQRVATHGFMMGRFIAKAGIKKASLFLINVKTRCTANLINKRGSSSMKHLKHQKTLRAINRAHHKQAQSLAKRAKRLDCKLTISVMFVSKKSIVI